MASLLPSVLESSRVRFREARCKEFDLFSFKPTGLKDQGCKLVATETDQLPCYCAAFSLTKAATASLRSPPFGLRPVPTLRVATSWTKRRDGEGIQKLDPMALLLTVTLSRSFTQYRVTEPARSTREARRTEWDRAGRSRARCDPESDCRWLAGEQLALGTRLSALGAAARPARRSPPWRGYWRWSSMPWSACGVGRGSAPSG